MPSGGPATGFTKSNSTFTALSFCAVAVKRGFFLETKGFGHQIPPEVKDSIAPLDVQDAVIDGEILNSGMDTG
jgi:hypothetical protein